MASSRIRYMDYLNVVACFAVVMLHSGNNVFTPQRTPEWTAALLVQAVFIIAVPIFFMISGANLLGYREKYDTKTFFMKRFKRTFAALLLASAIYYCASCFMSGFFALPPRTFSIVDFTKSFLTNGILSIYWFFYTILCLYVITPLLSMIAPHRKLMQYTLVVCFVVVSIIQFANRYLGLERYTSTFFALPMFTPSLLYYLLGYYLTHHLKRQFHPALLIAIFVACAASAFAFGYMVNNGGLGAADPGTNIFAGAHHASAAGGTSTAPSSASPGSAPLYDNWPAGISSPFCIFQAIALFLLFAGLEARMQRQGKAYQVVSMLSSATLGIYSVHMIFMFQIGKLGLHGIPWDQCFKPLAVYAISAAVVLVAQWTWKAIRTALRGLKQPPKASEAS